MPQTRTMYRYSPQPIEAYGEISRGVPCGPQHSALLQDLACWNLAFLSYPYESSSEPGDPNFTIAVRNTVHTMLHTGAVDASGMEPDAKKVRHMLERPAPQFVRDIVAHPVLAKLPLYHAYGPHWVETMQRRAYLCQVEQSAAPEDELTSLSEANALLGKLLAR